MSRDSLDEIDSAAGSVVSNDSGVYEEKVEEEEADRDMANNYAFARGMPNLVAAFEGAAAVAPAPADFNGATVQLDLMTPISHVSDDNLIVVNGNGTFSLRHTLARAFYIAANKPENAVAITQDVFDRARATVGHVIAMYNIHPLMASCGRALVIRASDTATVPEMEGVAGWAHYARAADAVYAWAATDASNAQVLGTGTGTDMAIMALYANAIYTGQCAKATTGILAP